MVSIDDATTLLYLTTKLEESLHLLVHYSDGGDLARLAEQKKSFLNIQQQIAQFIRAQAN